MEYKIYVHQRRVAIGLIRHVLNTPPHSILRRKVELQRWKSQPWSRSLTLPTQGHFVANPVSRPLSVFAVSSVVSYFRFLFATPYSSFLIHPQLFVISFLQLLFRFCPTDSKKPLPVKIMWNTLTNCWKELLDFMGAYYQTVLPCRRSLFFENFLFMAKTNLSMKVNESKGLATLVGRPPKTIRRKERAEVAFQGSLAASCEGWRPFANTSLGSSVLIKLKPFSLPVFFTFRR